jgi:hypothetical protein
MELQIIVIRLVQVFCLLHHQQNIVEMESYKKENNVIQEVEILEMDVIVIVS